MKRSEKRAKEKSGSRKDYFTITGILVYLCSLIFRIPFVYIIGEKGISYFSVANELFLVISCIFSYGLAEAAASLVRYRIKRDQMKNAEKVLQGAMILAAVTGLSFSIGVGFFAHSFAEEVMQIPLSGLAVSLMAPAIVFHIFTGVLKGYFQGNGTRVPAIHSQILSMIFMAAGGIIGALLLGKYGEKVSALLQNQDYACAYGAMGASIGILTASIFCFLHMLLLYLLYRSSMKRQGTKEIQKSQDTNFHITHMLLGTALPFSLFGLLYQAGPLIDLYLFSRLSDESTDTVVIWGNYYGKYSVITGVAGACITLFCVEAVRRIIFYMDRDEHRGARERIGMLVHQLVVIAIPCAVFTAVLAENILDLLFKGNNEGTASMVMAGSVIIVLFVLSTAFSSMLIRYRKMKYVITYGALAMILRIAAVTILLNSTKLGIMAVITGNIVFYLTTTIAGFLLVSRSFQYSQEWIRCFAFTTGAAAVAGLITMLLNRVFSPVLGKEVTLAICLPAGILCYMILLVVIRGVNERELENMAGGGMIIKAAKLLRLM